MAPSALFPMALSSTIILFVSVVVVPHVALGDTIRLMLLSDVHYDPAYGTSEGYGACTSSSSPEWGIPSCDAPLQLVQSAIRDAATQDPDLLLMSGDWLRHGFNSLPMSEAIPTFQKVAELMSEVMPNTTSSVFSVPNFQGALGNNDFIPDYHFNLSNPAHPLLLNQSKVLKDLRLLSSDESSTFGQCGYYSRVVKRRSTNASSGLRVIVLNTIMYSVLLDPPLTLNVEDPCDQFAFLSGTLYDARVAGDRVVIVAHIPPGMNLYNALSGGVNSGTSNRQFWFERFVTSFRNIVAAYKDVVTFQFYGHTHMFSVIADADLGVPGIIVPSVTRLFGNNPSYLIAEMDDTTWQVSDVHQRHFVEAPNGSVWWETGDATLGSLFAYGGDKNVEGSIFGEGNVTVLADGSIAMVSNDSLWQQFQMVHEGGVMLNLFPTPPGSAPPVVKGSCNSECKQIVLCSMLHVRWDAISSCVSSPMPTLIPASAPTTSGSGSGAGDPNPSNSGVAGGYIALYIMCAVLGICSIAVVGRRLPMWAKKVASGRNSEAAGLVSASPTRRELDSVAYDEGVQAV
ncbi:membrane-associated protein, putative [Bodo saltans]|uniref:Membrane-associated protein, putative n=1 Tax=Bodo saltans TaxID=75058 RepID=A0A0S4JQJ5_BODSA|nr:membrane-associated protein, putative [Bodo saltans]|eukprot:CUG91318.1 membrane-associated protein, putative [Bodo saltans]